MVSGKELKQGEMAEVVIEEEGHMMFIEVRMPDSTRKEMRKIIERTEGVIAC